METIKALRPANNAVLEAFNKPSGWFQALRKLWQVFRDTLLSSSEVDTTLKETILQRNLFAIAGGYSYTRTWANKEDYVDVFNFAISWILISPSISVCLNWCKTATLLAVSHAIFQEDQSRGRFDPVLNLAIDKRILNLAICPKAETLT